MHDVRGARMVPSIQRQRFDAAEVSTFRRKQFAPRALGRVGNLRFRNQPGATQGVLRIRAPRQFVRFLSWVASSVTPGGGRPAPRDALDQAYENSLLVADLLGSLTASPGDPKAQARIAKALLDLSRLSGGDLCRLDGGRESLGVYMGELLSKDLEALCGGVLGHHECRRRVLEQVGADRHGEAAQVLEQIAAALDHETARRAVPELLAQIGFILAGRASVDGLTLLKGRLVHLFQGLTILGDCAGDALLGAYMRTLYDDELRAWWAVLRPGTLDDVKWLLDIGSAQSVLDRLSRALSRAQGRSVRSREDRSILDLLANRVEDTVSRSRPRRDDARPARYEQERSCPAGYP
ncbi:hypothetical protein ACTPOE_14550 [Castellaniella sp. WN]